MSKTHRHLSETHIVGRRTRQWTVRAEECPALRQQRIAHVGVASAWPPYRMVRTHLNGTYLLACFGGRGRILLDGRWKVCGSGSACIAPPHVLHAFEASRGTRWEFCWVKYIEPAGQQPILTASSPVFARFAAEPLRAAILGLYHEQEGARDPAAIHHWVELIHTYVSRFARPWRGDDRLLRLWEQVSQRLGEEWTLERLGQCVHVSGEHLRRLCQRQLGRSPMQHVTYLRMERAAALLDGTAEKVDSIAATVGYRNPFVFSNTFKRWTGWRPSVYRGRAAAASLAASDSMHRPRRTPSRSCRAKNLS